MDGPAAAAQLSFPTGHCAGHSRETCISPTKGNSRGSPFIRGGWHHQYRRRQWESQTLRETMCPATSAQLDPVAVAHGQPRGNLFIADGGNNRIRKVDTNGTIRPLRATGNEGDPGDNGPATSAEIDFCYRSGFVSIALATSTAGSILQLRSPENRFTRITTAFAGGIHEGGSIAGRKCPATTAVMDLRWRGSFDGSGNLYISDANGYNTVVRRVDLSSRGLIYNVAGTGVNRVFRRCCWRSPAARAELSGLG